MKLFRNISILVLFLTISSGAFAQQQCALRLTDSSPHSGQYTAYIIVYYNGNPESTTQTYNVTVDWINYLPFDVLNEVEGDAYRIAVYVIEPFTGQQGPYWSALFNTDDWKYYDIDVEAYL